MIENTGWRLSVELARSMFDDMSAALEDEADALVVETLATAPLAREQPDDRLRLTLFGTTPLADDPRPSTLRRLLWQAGLAKDATTLEALPENDWGKASLASFEAITIGRFAIHGTHEQAPTGRIALCLDAGAAFGSGRHETTQGCLLALERLARRRAVRRALDIGTGSGVLAVAMAKLWPARIVAVDNDPVSVETARETVRQNAVNGRVTVRCGNGFRGLKARRTPDADLICANILARPLMRMAPALAGHLRRDGIAVLSGILASEERRVLGAYRASGLHLAERLSLGSWVTLILTR